MTEEEFKKVPWYDGVKVELECGAILPVHSVSFSRIGIVMCEPNGLYFCREIKRVIVPFKKRLLFRLLYNLKPVKK